MSTLDFILFTLFGVLVIGLGLWIGYRKRKQDSHEFFLAGNTLPWWAVGGALIASNISAEQFIGMTGTGYTVGMAVASYELMAAASLIFIAFIFIPFFLHHRIYTMPQFLEIRYNKQVKTALAFYWVILFVFVNISSVLYLGSLAIEKMGISKEWAILILILYSSATSIWGGLTAVVWTEVAQLLILLIGGLAVTYFSVANIQGNFLSSLAFLYEKFPSHFDLILSSEHSKYSDFPGWGMVFGGIWIANLYYWGMNQYIIQRALGAQNLYQAQKGIMFAAWVKLLMPLIVVLPGIAMFYHQPNLENPDDAYPLLMENFLPIGIKGLAFAALTAAVGSSISAMVNSASTIFTLDIYKVLFNPKASENHLVKVGKIASTLALLIGAFIAPSIGLFGQAAFIYIQKYTGYLSPAVVVLFLWGILWKKASAFAANIVVLIAIPLSIFLDFFFKDLPFIHQMGISFVVLSAVMIGLSFYKNKNQVDPQSLEFVQNLPKNLVLHAFGILGILTFIYYFFG